MRRDISNTRRLALIGLPNKVRIWYIHTIVVLRCLVRCDCGSVLVVETDKSSIVLRNYRDLAHV